MVGRQPRQRANRKFPHAVGPRRERDFTTPNNDHIDSEGARFTQTYVMAKAKKERAGETPALRDPLSYPLKDRETSRTWLPFLANLLLDRKA